MNKLWVVNNYKNDISWIDNYTSNYIIYDKSGELQETDKIFHQPNVGYNIYDYFYFIVKNYENLPDVCVFIKGNVFKHCKEEKFRKLINNNSFTPLESYEDSPITNMHKKDVDGGYMEPNNSWYIPCIINQESPNCACKYFSSYNDFLTKSFENPVIPEWIRFSPGCNYIVPKENILFYSKHFYERLMATVAYYRLPSEAHVLERGMHTIFTNKFKEK